MDTGTDYHGMARLSGPRAKVTMKFAGGTELKLHLDGDRGPGLGAIFVGEKGKIEINRNKLASNPKELVRSSDNPGPNRRPETAYHIENWIECIKSHKPCNADVEIGHRANTLCCLVNIVPRGRPRRRAAPFGTRSPSVSPTATMPTSSSPGRAARATSCRILAEEEK